MGPGTFCHPRKPHQLFCLSCFSTPRILSVSQFGIYQNPIITLGDLSELGNYHHPVTPITTLNTLIAHNITHAFGKNELLNDLRLELQTGTIKGLFGRNGSGKSTLLKILFGTLKNSAIQMVIDGKPVAQQEIIPLKKIAYLPQAPFLPKRLTVRNLLPMVFRDVALQELIFYRKGIAAFEKTPIGKLSIGQRKYLELLILSYMEHPFLLLDEPFSMVAPLYKEEIKKLLEEIKLFKGIIITDHYYHDVFEVSTHNWVLKNASLFEVHTETDLQRYDYLKRQ